MGIVASGNRGVRWLLAMVMLMGVAFWAAPAAAHGDRGGHHRAEARTQSVAPAEHVILGKAPLGAHRHKCAHDCDCPGDCSGGCADGCHFAALALTSTPMLASVSFARPSWTVTPSSPLLSTPSPLPAAPPDFA